MSADLPAAVRALIHEHIHSVGELELLMLLQSDPGRRWSVDELCAALRCPPSWATAQLEMLAAAGLVEPVGGGWRFAPARAELEHATAALEEAYRLRTRDVVRFIFATPGADLKAFSDAFRIRRGEER